MTLAEDPTIPPDRIVYRKIQLELLPSVFDLFVHVWDNTRELLYRIQNGETSICMIT